MNLERGAQADGRNHACESDVTREPLPASARQPRTCAMERGSRRPVGNTGLG
ncbi:MAG: hypothetical protein WA414_18485 [Acidobacteriaceae bacterium]